MVGVLITYDIISSLSIACLLHMRHKVRHWLYTDEQHFVRVLRQFRIGYSLSEWGLRTTGLRIYLACSLKMQIPTHNLKLMNENFGIWGPRIFLVWDSLLYWIQSKKVKFNHLTCAVLQNSTFECFHGVFFKLRNLGPSEDFR